MRTIRKKKYGLERVSVDETIFEDCIFENTVLVFEGRGTPIFRGGELRGVSLDCEGAAFETIKFLRQLVLMGGRDFVRAQFELSERLKN